MKTFQDIKTHQKTLGTLVNLAYIYLNHHKPKRALEYLRLAGLLDPQDKSVQKMLAVAYLDAGYPSHTLHTLDEMEQNCEIAPEDLAPIALLKSLAHKQLDHSEQSQGFFQEYMKRSRS